MALATVAVLLIGVTVVVLAIPGQSNVGQSNVASSVPEVVAGPTSTLEVANAISHAASARIDEFGQATSDELVDSVVTVHVQFFGQHADEIADYLLDPFPISLDSSALD